MNYDVSNKRRMICNEKIVSCGYAAGTILGKKLRSV